MLASKFDNLRTKFAEGSIERLEHISTPLILKWIKGVSKIIKNKLINTEVPDKLENIEILEIDEITDIFKKKTKDFGYGLLLTETGIKLLITKTSPKCRTIKLA